MVYEFLHETRLIPIGTTPHLPAAVRLWTGDSRAHWEGDTLVVDVTNYNDKGSIHNSAATGYLQGVRQSQALHVVERFTMRDADTIQYEATIEDPKVFTRPWKISMPFQRQRGTDRVLEYHCQAEKEEANGDFEPEPRTWYLGANSSKPPQEFSPPAEKPQAWKAPASVRRTADGKPDRGGDSYACSDQGADGYGHRQAAGAGRTPTDFSCDWFNAVKWCK